MHRNDQGLVSDYLDGDEESLKLLISTHLPSVYNFTYGLCGNKQDAEDIAQETFLKVWKNLRKYKPEQGFKTWLFSIARNTTIDLMRKRKNFVFSDFEFEDGKNRVEYKLADENPLADELSIQKEDKKVLTEAMEKLSPAQKTTLIMYYTEELTFKEIGEVLEKPLDTVKSQHRRALIRLRQIIGKL